MVAAAVMLLALAGSPAMAAAEASGKTVSIEDAVAHAHRNNPRILALREKVYGKSSAVSFSKSMKQPVFTISETVTRTNNPVYSFMSVLNQERFTPAHMASINDPGEVSNFNTKFSMKMPVYNGRRVRNGIAMARLDRSAAEYELAREKQKVKKDVVTAYMGVLLAKESLKVAEDAYRTAEAHVKTARSHLDAGTVVRSDVLSAEVRLARIDEMRLEARNRVELAKANLLFTMGADQNDSITLDENTLKYTPMKEELSTLVREAVQNRPEMERLSAYARMSEKAADAALGQKRPSLNLMAEYNLDNSDLIDTNGESWMAGVMVSIDIFDGGRAGSRADIARRREKETLQQKSALKQGIELQVRKAFLQLKTEKERIAVTKKAVEQAEEALRIVDNRYENGLTTIVEVLDAETSLTEARMRHVAAIHDYSVGLEELRFAQGLN